MQAIAALLFGLAVILVALTGLTAMLGAEKLRDGLARAAAGATVAALFLPYAARVLAGALDELGAGASAFTSGGIDHSAFASLFVVGHLGLAGAWVYARVGPPAFAENIARSRGRGRERVMPALEPEARDE